MAAVAGKTINLDALFDGGNPFEGADGPEKVDEEVGEESWTTTSPRKIAPTS